MPSSYRYSASLDKTYREDERIPLKLPEESTTQNGNHNRTCSMDSLDSISSSAGSIAGSTSSCSVGNHSRQVSADSTSSPTNISPNSLVNSRKTRNTSGKASPNPHQFIKARTSPIHKAVPEQIKVKEVTPTKSPIKDDAEEWQTNLSSWKSKRRTMSEKTFQRVDEIKQLETVSDTSSKSAKRRSKTFSQMCQDKADRPSYNLALLPDASSESKNDSSSEETNNNNEASENSDSDSKNQDSSFLDTSSRDLMDDAIKDKDDGYSSKDECNKTETDEQSDTAPADDQMSVMTESSGVSEREISSHFLPNPIEDFSSSHEENLELASTTSTSVTNSSEEDYNLAVDDNILENNEMKLNEDDKLNRHSSCAQKTVLLTLRSTSDVKDFGFAIKGGKECQSNVIIDYIAPNGAANKAGLKVNDYIVSINEESTSNRSHSALVFAIKQAVYTGQLVLEILSDYSEQDLGRRRVASLENSKPCNAFKERRSFFIKQEEALAETKKTNPSKDVVSRRRSMFDNISSQEQVKPNVSVEVNRSLKDRVASFGSIDDPAFRKIDNVFKRHSFKKENPKDTPEKIPNKLDESILKDTLLSQPDLIETNVDSCSDKDKQDDVTRELEEEVVIKDCVPDVVIEQSEVEDFHEDFVETKIEVEEFVETKIEVEVFVETKIEVEEFEEQFIETKIEAEEFQEEFVKTEIELQDDKLVHLCEKLRDEAPQEEPVAEQKDHPIEEGLPDTSFSSLNESSHSNISVSVPSTQNDTLNLSNHSAADYAVEDVSSALDEALAIFDDDDFEPSASGDVSMLNESHASSSCLEPESDTSDLNIIYDSSCASINMDDFLNSDSFDRPKSISAPPSEKPPPPPVESDPLQKIPPMKRINSTKRIKKEISKMRYSFLGLGDSTDSSIDLDADMMKPRPHIEDLLRSELEMQKSLQTPVLSSTKLSSFGDSMSVCSSSASELDVCVKECVELNHAVVEEKIKMMEIEKNEEDRLLHERVEQMRKQQEMLIIERERLKREQEEVLRARRNSTASSDTSSSCDTPSSVPVKHTKSRSRPRAPPPPPPKPSAKSNPHKDSALPLGQDDRSELIRLSKRPTSGDFSGIDLGSVEMRSQPIQKQPLSRHSLQSLSAVPKANLSNTDSYWLKKETSVYKKKSDVPRKDTYSHWLIQEAEIRRITEHSERKSLGIKDHKSFSKSETNINRDFDQINRNSSYELYKSIQLNNSLDKQLDTISHTNHLHYDQYQPRPSMVKSKSIEALKGCETPFKQNGANAHPEHSSYSAQKHSVPSSNGVSDNIPSMGLLHSYDMKYPDYMLTNDQYFATELDNNRYNYEDIVKSSNKVQDQNILSVSGRKRCSNCCDELGRGAAMIIESLQLFYHIKCFRCSVCQVQLGNGSCGADVRVRNNKLHCQNCYSNDEAGLKFSKV